MDSQSGASDGAAQVTPDSILEDISDWEQAQRKKIKDDEATAEERDHAERMGRWAEAKLLTFQQVLDRPPQEPLIEGNILFKRSTAWLAGSPGSYKSFVANDFALCVATGRPWLGNRVAQGRVLMIAGEGVAGLGRRTLAWLSRNGLDGDALVNAIDYMEQTDLVHGADRDYILAMAGDAHWSLIVIDTQARMTPGISENDKHEIDGFIDVVTRLATKHGACVLTIHHATKSGSDPLRGSGSILGAADTVLVLEREEDTQLEVSMKVWKHKDTESGMVIPLTLSSHRFGEGDDDVSLVIDPGISQDDLYSAGLGGPSPEDHKKLCGHVLAELSAVGSSAYTRTQLAKWLRELGPKLKIKVDYSTAMKVINDLEDRGSVEELRTKMSLTTAGRTLLSWSQSYGFAPGEPAPSRED